MKEDQEQGGALVPSASRTLTRNSTGLIRRGLDDLLNEQSRINSSDGQVNERKAAKSEQASGEFQLDNLDEADQVQQLKIEYDVFDDEAYAKAKPYFIAGFAHINREGMSAGDSLRALMRHLVRVDGFSREKLAAMKPYILRFMEELRRTQSTSKFSGS